MGDVVLLCRVHSVGYIVRDERGPGVERAVCGLLVRSSGGFFFSLGRQLWK